MSAPLSPQSHKSIQALHDLFGKPVHEVDVRPAPEPPPGRRWLLVLRDGDLAHRILLMGPTASLGSNAACDIQVDHPRVDPVHLEISPHDDGAVFVAAGATGFEWQGTACRAADVAWGVPVFLGDLLMITVEPWNDPPSAT
jgi:hypothetical protein